jgi:hypothetical protein
MKKLFILALPIIWLLCTAIRCTDKENETCHTAIRFSNNSPKDLRVKDDICIDNIQFSCGIETLSYTVRNEIFKVKSGEQNNYKAISSSACIENVFKMEGSSGVLSIYVFDAEVVENTPWEVVARDYLVLKRYDLTLDDLQRLNWTVTYPPTEVMKDVKQFPPFESK